MGIVTTTERERYENIWTTVPEAYAATSPGLEALPVFLEYAHPPASVLDAGCGSGRAAVALRNLGFEVQCCDLTHEGLIPEARSLPFQPVCLWQPLRPALRRGLFDWVYCADVLEHVPPQFTMLAIDQMLRVAGCGLFLSIAFVGDAFGAWIGEALHQTVQPYVWWRDSLREVGTVVEARDLISHGLFLVTRK